jgi:hypothetical protein
MPRCLPITFVALVAACATARGEIAPQTPEQLEARSTHIAIGEVTAIYTDQTRSGDWLKTVGVVEIRVAELDKGDRLESGDAVYARFWRQQWRGEGNPDPFGSGHRLPKKGDTVRVYLRQNAGGYDALLPNGIEVISKAEDKADE